MIEKIFSYDADGMLYEDRSLLSQVREELGNRELDERSDALNVLSSLRSHERGFHHIKYVGLKFESPINPHVRVRNGLVQIVSEICYPLCRYGVDRSVTLGRSERSEIILPHKHVSRAHFEISSTGSEGNVVQVTDIGSMNKTIVNGKELHRGGTKVLGPRAVIEIPGYKITLNYLEEMY